MEGQRGNIKLESQISGQHNKAGYCVLRQAKTLAEKQVRSFWICSIPKGGVEYDVGYIVLSSGESFALEIEIWAPSAYNIVFETMDELYSEEE